MKEVRMDCPSGHGKMVLRKTKKRMTFRGVNIIAPIEQYRCTVCGVETATVTQAADTQMAISEAYRKAVNLLTGKEIVEKSVVGRSGMQVDIKRKMAIPSRSMQMVEKG
jgi:hypothetical protein